MITLYNQQMDIHEQRQLCKIALETFYFDEKNFFDSDIEILISLKIEKLNRLQKELNVLEISKNKKYKNYDIEAYQQEYMFLQEAIFYNEQELQALSEMQIIYSYKLFEIALRRVLSAAFDLKNNRELYKWDNIVRLLASKGLKVREVAYYSSINQLRIVNNAIKHSGVVTPEIKRIPEFTSDNHLSYQNLQRFYERIKLVPIRFSEALTQQIYLFLYSYNDDRIMKIAKKVALRMEKDDAEKLSKVLLSLYH